jgi:hypothetical protein
MGTGRGLRSNGGPNRAGISGSPALCVEQTGRSARLRKRSKLAGCPDDYAASRPATLEGYPSAVHKECGRAEPGAVQELDAITILRNFVRR